MPSGASAAPRYVESGMVDLEMHEQSREIAERFEPPVDEVVRLASVFTKLADSSRGMDNLHRYETRARRAFNAGLNALEQLRRLSSPPAAEAAPQPAPEPQPAAQRLAPQHVAPKSEKLQNEMVPAAPRTTRRHVLRAFGVQTVVKIKPRLGKRHV